MASDVERSNAYYDTIARHYDADVTASSRDRLARRAFVELVSRVVPAGSLLLDFGCGTGLDCDVYARHGFTVLAYDSSAGMRRELERRCAEHIRESRVRLAPADAASLQDALLGWPRPSAIASDFAVLNMVRDLDPLFATLARHIEPGGGLVISVLNPCHWREMIKPRWWGAVLHRNCAVPHPHLVRHFNSYLHFEAEILRAARGFRLVGRANAGSIVRYDRVVGSDKTAVGSFFSRIAGVSGVVGSGFSRTPGGAAATRWWGDEGASPVKRLVWRTPLRRLLGTFVFLVFKRDA